MTIVYDPLLVTSHSLTLTGLAPATRYTVTVRSTNARGVGSAVSTFTTATPMGLPDSIVVAQSLAGISQVSSASGSERLSAVQTLGAVGQAATALLSRGVSVSQTLSGIGQAFTGKVTYRIAAAQGLGGLTQAALAHIGTSAATLNPSDKGTLAVLSNGNLTMGIAANGGTPVHTITRSTSHKASGVYQTETTITALVNNIGVGLATSFQGLNGVYLGQDGNGVGYFNDGFIGYNGSTIGTFATFTTGDVIGTKWDADGGAVSFYKNGTLVTTVAVALGDAFFAVDSKLQGDIATVNFGAVAFAHAISGAAVWDTSSSSTTSSPGTWSNVALGGGGYVTGLDAQADGTQLFRTDVAGGFLLTNTGHVQLFTVASTGQTASGLSGCYEVVAAPSSTSTLYSLFNGNAWKSTDKGAHWTVLGGGLPSFGNDTPSNFFPGGIYDTQRYWQKKAAVDPFNANHVILGLGTQRAWQSYNGGTSFTQIGSPVPTGTVGPPSVGGIVFNPYGGTVTVGGATCCKEVWLFAQASGGYRSIDGGQTWTKPTGGPSEMAMDACFAADGQLYATIMNSDFISHLWRWSGTAWADLGNFGASGIDTAPWLVTCDPFDGTGARLLVAELSGRLKESVNHGASFGTLIDYANITENAVGDVTWIGGAGTGTSHPPWDYISMGGIRFDPSTQNKVIACDGVGTMYVTGFTPGSTSLTWKFNTAGIEMMVANDMVATTTGIVGMVSWDRAAWFKTASTLNTYSASYYGQPNFCAGWAIDYLASNQNFIVQVSEWGSLSLSGYSTNGGGTWTTFSAPTQWSFLASGSIAVSTTTNFVRVGSNRVQPVYTTNAGTSWTFCSFPDIPLMPTGSTDPFGSHGSLGTGVISTYEGGGFIAAYYDNAHPCAADRVNTGTFYLRYDGYTDASFNSLFIGGFLKSTDGGATFKFANNLFVSPGSPATQTISSLPSGTYSVGFASGSGSITMSGAATGTVTAGGPKTFTGSGNLTLTLSGTVTNPVVVKKVFETASGFTSRLASPDGQAGHVWFSTGLTSPRSTGTSCGYSTDGGATWTVLSAVKECWQLGFGPVVGSYPRVWIFGVVGTGALGLYHSDNQGSTWTFDTAQPGLAVPACLEGDKLLPNRVYVGYGGSGWRYYDTV